MRRTRADIEAVCEQLGHLALERADRSAITVARMLTRDVQFFAYSALLDDRNERVRQLVATCPALLSLASGLSPHVGEGAELLHGIRAGRKLNTLVAETLEVASQRFSAAPGDQAIALLRCAPSMPLLDVMYMLSAPGIDINDLHASRRQRRSWFETMIEWGRLASQLGDRDRGIQLGSFISKYAVALGESQGTTLGEILDWVTRSGALVPTRSSSFERVRRDIDAWHASLYEIECDPATPLARPPTTQRVVPELVIEPLLTVGDLVDEGRQMRHCVASFAPDAISGWISVFRATVCGTRVTVAVFRGCGGWGLMEASGFANTVLDAGSVGLLRFWAESLT
jgi:hypothetical protein